MRKTLYYLTAALILLSLFTSPVSGETHVEKMIPKSISPGLDHLAELICSGTSKNFELDRIEPILNFIQNQKPDSSLYYPEKKFDATPIYYEFDLNLDLKEIIKYSYNPKIPVAALMPSSLRSSTWENAENEQNSPSLLWNSFQDLEKPVIINGTENTVITPDITSGAYYGYNQNRKMILCKYKGKKLFISLAKQKDRSDVGKKGLVLGSDSDWNYLYSGKKGTNLPGLGWVSSYMYDSCTIMIYYEMDPNEPLVRCAVFKWLKAGWSNINMVKKSHIYKGLIRYENSFKKILEHPLLPKPEILEKIFAGFRNKPIEELRKGTKDYFCYLNARYKDNKNLVKTKFNKLLVDNKFLMQMTKTEMVSILSVEYIKTVLGKEHSSTDLLTRISR